MGMRTCLVGGVAMALISCGGSENSGGSGAVTGSLTGTWDVTTLGDDPTKNGSQLIVANDTVTGTLIDEDEGKDIGDGCVHTKNRATLQFNFQGNAMSGTITVLNTWTNTGGKGSSDPYFYCPTGDSEKPYTMTGTRTNAGAGADGDWEITYSKKDPFLVSISGNTGKAWEDAKDKLASKQPKMTAVVIGNSATTSGDEDLGFTGTRR